MKKLFCVSLLLSLLSGCFPVVATGVGAGALIAGDRRSAGAYIDDQSIEMKAGDLVDKTFKSGVHLNITSYNRNVLLTGEAPDAAAREKIEKLVRGVPNVRSITDEVVLDAPASLSARSHDTLVTSRVKGRIIDSNKVPAIAVKVVTERNVVYLLGLVSQKEGNDASEIARTTEGVERVVTVFEYID